MAHHTDVFISSTKDDLIEYRQIAINACKRLGLFPIAMEDFMPDPNDAMKFCESEVDRAEAFIGIYAHRYGWQPFDKESITEMEYHWAMKRNLPVFIFVIDEDANWKVKFVDDGDKKTRLTAFKQHVMGKHIIRKFTDDTKTFNDDMFLCVRKIADLHKQPLGADIHYVSDIPKPPEPYIAHPYTLMHASRLFGRQAELNLLTDWVSKPASPAYTARILNVVAIGGMGKSALTWHWFNEIAPLEMTPLAGRLWWSFYESDASFENFIIRALAYVTGGNYEQIRREKNQSEIENTLLQILDREPFLLVLDGLERILIAYARMDAARVSDDDYDERTANYIASVSGLPEGAGEQFVGKHHLRKTADLRVGKFLKRLAGVRASRILVSTRLYPADLQDPDTRDPINQCAAIFLKGLSDNDALDLWRALKVTGNRDELLRVFRQFGNYPLLIRALAGEVNGYRPAPGNFDQWREKYSDFTPILMGLQQKDAKSHVLAYALNGLGDDRRAVLTTLAAFRAPAGYETLAALMVGEDSPLQDGEGPGVRSETPPDDDGKDSGVRSNSKPFPSESHLDAALDELEQRGLIGWDRRANRYDLHPIVRGVTWGTVKDDDRRDVYESLRGHFESVPKIDQDDVTTLEDLTPAIELYQALVGLGRYDEARELFRDRINQATLYRLSASRQRAELLEMLFSEEGGTSRTRQASSLHTTSDEVALPRLSNPAYQAWTLNALATAYVAGGQPGRAAPLFRREIRMREEQSDLRNASVTLGNLSNALRLTGGQREAESAARRALVITREREDRFQEAVSLYWWGLALAARGSSNLTPGPSPSWRGEEGANPAEAALRRALKIRVEENNKQGEGYIAGHFAQAMLWRGDFAAARELADRAWELAGVQRYEGDFIRSSRLQGEAAMGLGDFETVSERLYHALTRARAVNLAEEELASLVALAEMAGRQGNLGEARRTLDEVWEAAERAPYPLIHADALNVLAQIERDEGNHDAAVVAARGAYEKAWCDGSPFAYHRGLEQAKAHLDVLGAKYPNMPPFDESKYGPMVEVEIEPPEEEEESDE